MRAALAVIPASCRLARTVAGLARLLRAVGLAGLAVVLGMAGPTLAAGVDAATLDYRLAARALAPDVYVVEGDHGDFSRANGCNLINTGFIVGSDGVLVINTGPSRLYGEQLRALIARTTPRPVKAVLHLNLHPDYFLGNQAFADVPRWATAATLEGMRAEAKAYEDNLYRLCGDWMKGTETLLPDRVLPPAGPEPRGLELAGRRLALRELKGHTASDLVLTDTASGVVFAGGLVFADRVPTTPHAQAEDWLASLGALAAPPAGVLVPSHGTVGPGGRGIEQTRRYLAWLDARLADAARRGLDVADLLALPVPDEYRRWGAFETEYVRNIMHLYPRHEARALQGR